MFTIPNYDNVFSGLINNSITSGEFACFIIRNLVASVKDSLLSSVSDVLPVALSVAGAVLVVNLGWRLFRNFTRG